ncbi:hypothetical protein LOZ53_003631 [Ophidiomyces ophidiicola]|nr:hypothetical protein LOZ56_005473 [Ophidiomyces ophidiicola]KAI1976755.1 hypothetical protein LOZ55_004045 [Ophidiomyces ophidiicola]KAI1989225.1 hypothetical protein LOZ53_003631 [Ophidiomyces ophidiicola]KAI1994585.1 hypothetical protein LOZ51_003781 [Ophidiomyces ophidiicola]KAI2015780.1 hypothetical protein LOZ46_005169 [Ophidiomyces ophidiicola]
MANIYSPQLTLLEKLDFLPAGLSLAATAIVAAVTGIFRGQEGASSYPKHVCYAVLRQSLWRLTPRQHHSMWIIDKDPRAIKPATSSVYKDFAKANAFTPQTVDLVDGSQGHWIGNKDAKNVVVYFHGTLPFILFYHSIKLTGIPIGGGFALSAYPAHFQFFREILDGLNASGKDVAFFVLSYSLCPDAVYPTQMKQAVEALRYVISTGRSPSNIIIGGDSAGGNLTLAVLSHISHPHSAIAPLEISTPLAGAFTMAPWVTFSHDFPSVKTNASKDMLREDFTTRWGLNYLGGQAKDYYNQPYLAPTEWWKGLKTNSLLVLAGSDEILLSSIEEFVKKIKPVVPDLTFIIGKNEAHDAPIVQRMVGDWSQTQQGEGLRLWLSSRL